MLVLGIESSTPVASVALVSSEGLKGEITLNVGLTHSEQLLPLIDNLLQQTRIAWEEVEGIAVAGGPGSFTGLRIGMATAKGLAQGRGIPLAGVSTLRAMAYTKMGHEGLISPLLNARRKEVYASLFRLDKGGEEQIIPDTAVNPEIWAERLKKYGEPVLLTGDGASVYKDVWKSIMGELVMTLPTALSVANAVTIAWLGREKLLVGCRDDLYQLKPVYLRTVEAQAGLKATKCMG